MAGLLQESPQVVVVHATLPVRPHASRKRADSQRDFGRRSLSATLNAAMNAGPRPSTARDQQQRFEDSLARYLRGKNMLSEAELQEALTQQLIMGGQLGTALWELGLVPGKSLQAITAGLLKMPAVDPATIQSVPPGILAKLDRGFVERARILPFSVAGKVMRVATCEPWNIKALDEAAFLSGLRLEIYVLAEVPLVRLLEKNYGIKAGPRFRLQPQPRIRQTPTAAPADTGPIEVGDLMGEDTFAEMYAGHEDGRPTTRDVPTAAPVEEDVVEILEVIEDAVDHGPLDRKEAVELLQQAHDRDGIATVLARVALKVGKRVVLFSRQGDLWMGWTGVGQGITPAAVQALMIPSAKGTAFGPSTRPNRTSWVRWRRTPSTTSFSGRLAAPSRSPAASSRSGSRGASSSASTSTTVTARRSFPTSATF